MAQTFHYAGPITATRDQALLVIFNNEQTKRTRKYSIIKCDVQPIIPTTTTPGTLALRKITAISGGTSIPVIPADNTNASINSLISLKTFADVTQGTADIRTFLPLPVSTQGQTLMATGFNGDNSGGLRQDTGNLWDSGFVNSTTQRIVLREGEGVALVPKDPVNGPINASWYCYLTLQIGSATYYAMCTITPTAGMASLALFNGTGSGQVIEIANISLTYIGQPTTTTAITDAPLVRFIRIAGYDGGVAVTPDVRNTAYPAPSSLGLIANQLWSPLTIDTIGEKLGMGQGEYLYPEQNTALFRRIGIVRRALTHMFSVMAPGLATVGVCSEFQWNAVQHGLDYQGDNNIQPLVLQPGEGLAVVVNNATPYCGYWVDVSITHTPPIDGPSKFAGDVMGGL